MLMPVKKQKGRNDMTFLDLLVIVSEGLVVAGVLTLTAMFVLKGEKARRVCLYIAAGLGLYMGYVGYRINAMSYGSGSGEPSAHNNQQIQKRHTFYLPFCFLVEISITEGFEQIMSAFLKNP